MNAVRAVLAVTELGSHGRRYALDCGHHVDRLATYDGDGTPIPPPEQEFCLRCRHAETES